MTFAQLHYFLSQNIGGDKRYYVPPCSKVGGDMSPRVQKLGGTCPPRPLHKLGPCPWMIPVSNLFSSWHLRPSLKTLSASFLLFLSLCVDRMYGVKLERLW